METSAPISLSQALRSHVPLSNGSRIKGSNSENCRTRLIHRHRATPEARSVVVDCLACEAILRPSCHPLSRSSLHPTSSGETAGPVHGDAYDGRNVWGAVRTTTEAFKTRHGELRRPVGKERHRYIPYCCNYRNPPLTPIRLSGSNNAPLEHTC